MELLDGKVQLIQSDARNIPLPDGSVDCCVTSPPYWGLRDYGTGTWEGGEQDCEHSVGGQVQDTKWSGAITTGVRPGVDASTCLKCGAKRIDNQLGLEKTPEEYVQHMVEVFREVKRVLKDEGTLWLNLGDSYAAHPGQRKDTDKAGEKQQTKRGSTGCPSRSPEGVKAKDLVGIPWMVAFALRADGWYLRSDIIWAKKNAMPESVKDRPTRSHEYIFLLSKSPKYYYDHDAIKEPCVSTELKKFTDNGVDKQRGHSRRHAGFNGRYAQKLAEEGVPEFRNKRDVWEVNTSPYRGAHFATFPPKLIEPCILAGCPENGLVLDPFGGSGTTGRVAIDNGRRAVLLDLNYGDKPGSYLELAKERILAPAKPKREKETEYPGYPVPIPNLLNYTEATYGPN